MKVRKTKARTRTPKNLSLSVDAILMGERLQKLHRRPDFSNMVEHLIVEAHDQLTGKKSEAA